MKVRATWYRHGAYPLIARPRGRAHAVSRRAVTAEARVQSQISPCGICGGESGSGRGFSLCTSIFPC